VTFKLVSLRASGFKRLNIEDRLRFPEGRLLVHGRNESGKSTLMEAIHYALYGMPLRPSKNAGNDDIICYGRDQAIVELEFSIEDTNYLVRRELHRKKSNVHLLNKREPDGGLSRVTTGARNVNNEISDILHGIDSDALLNSCLVEQKELGKLEDANKQERIKAMSSLLNLEDFIGARDELKKDANELRQVHSQTMLRLQEAEKASKDYDEAEKRHAAAEKRLAEIEGELRDTLKRLSELEESIKVLEEMKRLKAAVEEAKLKRGGLEGQLRQLETRLGDVEKAEEVIEEIEEALPTVEAELKRLEEKTAVLDEILRLVRDRDAQKGGVEKTTIRIEEATRLLSEALEAQEKLRELEGKVTQLANAREAEKAFNTVSVASQGHLEIRSRLERLRKQLEDHEAKIDSLRESETVLARLEEREEQLSQLRDATQRRRYMGLPLIAVGLLLLILYSVHIALPVVGVMLAATGAFLYARTDVKPVDGELYQARRDRERMAGDISRISEFRGHMEETQRQIAEAEARLGEEEERLVNALNTLPKEPRDYSSLVKLENPATVDHLRDAVQEDLRSLSGIEGQMESLRNVASELETRQGDLKELEEQVRNELKEVSELNDAIGALEEEKGVAAGDEAKLRKQLENVHGEATQLRTRLESSRETAAQRDKIETELGEARDATVKLAESIERDGEALGKMVESHGFSPEDEPRLRSEHRDADNHRAELRMEQRERENDISESAEAMERCRPLKEEYPKLLEEGDREEFMLEAMRRATVLLDTTRDSIMAGVKQNVEKHMMQFLPTLTDQRYNMARIDEENYRIEVYDREAKHWRGKGVFSGATQDQFSLALRLAFAVSTIPSMRGTRPGFIFLDEPLSGFDAQRRLGFMQLLKEDLSQYFDQVIVVSHIEALSDEFPHNMHLDSGCVVEA